MMPAHSHRRILRTHQAVETAARDFQAGRMGSQP